MSDITEQPVANNDFKLIKVFLLLSVTLEGMKIFEFGIFGRKRDVHKVEPFFTNIYIACDYFYTESFFFNNFLSKRGEKSVSVKLLKFIRFIL